jgi:hypothetical protein
LETVGFQYDTAKDHGNCDEDVCQNPQPYVTPSELSESDAFKRFLLNDWDPNDQQEEEDQPLNDQGNSDMQFIGGFGQQDIAN